MKLSEQEAHCIARLLQGSWYSGEQGLGGSLRACAYCKYQCYKEGKNLPTFDAIRKRLSSETGVKLVGEGESLLESEFPYFMFLKNANEEIKEYYRARFSNI